MIGQNMKAIKLVLTVLFLSGLANCAHQVKADLSSRSVASKRDWTYCYKNNYNNNINKVYFLASGSTPCGGNTSFSMPMEFYLHENLPSVDGSTIVAQAQPRFFHLKDGSTVFVSQWDNASRENTVMVHKVNLSRGTVTEYCRKESNYSPNFDVREEGGVLQISLKKYKAASADEPVRDWFNCRRN